MKIIPTISQLYTSVLADLQTEFGVIINPVGKAFMRGYAAVQSAKLKLLYYFLGNIQKNVWVDTADPEAAGGTLERFGRTKKLAPFPAEAGQYIVSVSGNAGATINASTTYKSDDTSLNPGFLFVLDNTYILSGSGDTILLRALTEGTGALLAVSNTLTATQPIDNVNASGAVSSISVSPLDGETIEQFRARVDETYVLEPQGGAVADYRLWGREVAGVAQIYPYAVSGSPNTIATYVEAILSDSTDGKGTPTTTILNEVTAIYAPANGLKPLGVQPIQVNAVIIQTVDVIIPGTGGLLTTAQKTLITTAITQALSVMRPFIAGTDILANRNDTITVNLPSSTGSTIPITQYVLVSIISNAVPGAIFGTPTLNITPPLGSPASISSYLFDLGSIPYLNSVTFP